MLKSIPRCTGSLRGEANVGIICCFFSAAVRSEALYGTHIQAEAGVQGLWINTENLTMCSKPLSFHTALYTARLYCVVYVAMKPQGAFDMLTIRVWALNIIPALWITRPTKEANCVSNYAFYAFNLG